MHGVLVVDGVGLHGGRRSGVEAWTERLPWRVAQRNRVLFYMCSATEKACVCERVRIKIC